MLSNTSNMPDSVKLFRQTILYMKQSSFVKKNVLFLILWKSCHIIHIR